jgi:hypothetical protein
LRPIHYRRFSRTRGWDPKLEAGPTRPGERMVVREGAKQHAAQIDMVARARFDAEERARRRELEANAAAFGAKQSLGAVGIFAGRAQGDPLRRKLGAVRGAANPLQRNLMAAAGGGGIVGSGEEGTGQKRAATLQAEAAERDAERRERIERLTSQKEGLKEDIAEHGKRPFQSEHFGSASEFASSAIQKALSDDDDVPKKQLEKLAEVEKELKDLNKKTEEYVNALKNARQGGAILRGAS